ncbi:hypothetical protein [Paraburkholderia kirstenboschensis]|uniref:Uncharacterized protein n=1 Tax=Paraburkholderia kirstenboschensis TaxID=1245436 RepID=A0ABZ0ECT3_9BURK|nr:hypothetical protein [Paraburkholderia kirstenboschensis]WOD14002.1 hypothetical protein RW095_00190 [Paraburkholderia kirstenboschensis]
MSRTEGFHSCGHTALDESEVRRHQVTGDEFDGYAQKGQPPVLLLALVRIRNLDLRSAGIEVSGSRVQSRRQCGLFTRPGLPRRAGRRSVFHLHLPGGFAMHVHDSSTQLICWR